jgi:glutathione S-transferase
LLARLGDWEQRGERIENDDWSSFMSRRLAAKVRNPRVQLGGRNGRLADCATPRLTGPSIAFGHRSDQISSLVPPLGSATFCPDIEGGDMPLKLAIANKAYSSWSLRPWLLLTHFGIPFDEVVIPMDRPDTRARILEHSPTAKCPALHDGPIAVWESLAIVEYVAETHPEKPIWPTDRAARALARSLSSEMHAGFQALRSACPTNFRRQPRRIALSAEVRSDVDRIQAAWADARGRFGGSGAFLFGNFSAADAMFAPVVNRLHAYDIDVQPATRAYMDAVMALPAWLAWHEDARAEPWFIERYEAI